MTDKPANNQIERPPVIAVMGHVDHGKSTLLDYIRKTNVVAREAGGITQHISAYEVSHETPSGEIKKITFLDTPGHAAFESIRARGAQIADIAILIVSAEDGVKAQTVEVIKAIHETKTPFIVAINKIDKPNANIDRTKRDLAEAGVLLEGYGGQVPFVPISAKSGEGVSELLDTMLLVAELEQLTGNPDANGEGYVLEANLDSRVGVTTTFIIKNGTINTGDYAVVFGEKEVVKIKKIENFLGETVDSATFSSPVRIFGFNKIPKVGASFITFKSKKEAERFCQDNSIQTTSTYNTSSPEEDTNKLVLPIILKADVCGTLEALQKEVGKINHEQVTLKIIQTGIGAITENDVKLASGSANALIVGFNVKVDRAASDLAERLLIPIKTFNIIYKLSEWLEEEVNRQAPKVNTDKIIGVAKVLKVFLKNKDRQVIGGAVTDGKIMRGREVKILRRDAEIGRGIITDLEENKLKTSEVEKDKQFGAVVEAKIMIAAGDILEVFETITK